MAYHCLLLFFLSFSPRCSVLANIKGTDIYKDKKDYTDVSGHTYRHRLCLWLQHLLCFRTVNCSKSPEETLGIRSHNYGDNLGAIALINALSEVIIMLSLSRYMSQRE